MSKYPPIYKFEATNARDPKSVDVTLRFDTPKEVEGKWGPQYMYGITVEGTDYTLYATPGLHRSIQETGARQGETISVIRFGEGKDTRWDVIHTKDFSAKNSAHGNVDPFITPQERNAPKRDAGVVFHENMMRYQIAWNMAHDFLQQVEGQGDLNAVAFTFYKMAQDAQYDLLNEDDKPPFKENNEEGKV